MFDLGNYYLNVHAIPVFLVAFFIVFLGVFVCTREHRSEENFSFLLICLSVFVWLFCTAFGYLSTSPEIAEKWFKIDNFGVVFISVSVYYFVTAFLGLSRRKVIYSGYLAAAMFGVATLSTNFLVLGAKRHFWGFFPVWGARSFFVLFLFFIFMALSILELVREYPRIIDPLKRNQLVYVMSAVIGGFTGSVDYLPTLGVEIYPFGYLSIAFFISLISYAIVRHHLMDIEVIVKKTLIFTGLFIASYAIFASFAYFGSAVFENFTHNRWLAMAPTVFIIVLVLRPLEVFLRHVTDRYLFQKAYDYKELLKTFTGDVLTVLNMHNLVNITVDKLAEIMKLSNAEIFLYKEEENEFRIAAAVEEPVEEEMRVRDANIAWSLIRKSGQYLIRGKEKEDEILRSIRGEVIIPLSYRNNLLGILSLGKKKSDEAFTEDDIDILLPLARTLSVAITNAQLFEKLSQSQAQAAQREKMAVVGTLSAGINHEICNPLGIVRGQCEMFLLNLREGLYHDKTPEQLVEKAREIMEKVIKETDRATAITKKLSAFAKPAMGKKEEDVQIEKELDEVLSLMEQDLRLEDIEIRKEIDRDLPCIAADRKQLQEIFFNIIRNAAQAITGKGSITIRSTSKSNKVFIDIEDTGKGMNKSEMTQIFDPFFTTKEPGQGTGLGLFIVKQIVEKNNGRISVRSEPGKGTNFRLVFNASGSAGSGDQIIRRG